MARSLARNASMDSDALLPRSFGERVPVKGERLPLPVAGAVILALSVASWVVIIQAGRLVVSFLG